MVSKRRRILFLLFILIFAIISSLTILYTSGYSINWTWPPNFNQVFQKTGMLVLETEPEGADIYINGKTQKRLLGNIGLSQNQENIVKTPAKIKYIAPGKYHIRLKKENYWPWEKELRILPGKQTKTQDIILFKKSLPSKIVSSSAQKIKISPDKNYILLPKDDLLVNLNKEQAISIKSQETANLKATSTAKTISWSQDSQKFLIGTKIYNIDDIKNPINLDDKLLNSNVKNIKWLNNSVIYYQFKNSIAYYDINQDKSETILSLEKNIIDYLPGDDRIYIINSQGMQVSMEIYSIDSKTVFRKINIPYSTSYTFINPSHKLINLYDKNYNILYLINEDSFFNPIKIILENIKYTDWVGENKLVYANKFEIWTYNIENNKKTLLTRISEPIIGVSWHHSMKYALYYTKTAINVIENKQQTKKSITNLTNVTRIYSSAKGMSGNFIYFNAKIGRSTGLYKLSL